MNRMAGQIGLHHHDTSAVPADNRWRTQTGWQHSAMSDRVLLTCSAGFRSAAAGCTGILLGSWAAAAKIPPLFAGTLVSVGLAGAALAALIVTLRGDQWGRRRTLATLAGLSAIGGTVLALLPSDWHGALLAAALIGMVNGMGKDRSAALNIEQAMLPNTTTDAGRTQTFAWYSMTADIAGGLGALAAGLPSWLVASGESASPESCRWMIGAVALIGVIGVPLALAMSPAVEAPALRLPVSPEGRRTITKLSGLFALDAIGGGLLTTAAISYILADHFSASPGYLAVLFAGAKVLNAVSHLGAAWLAKRIGLVNTMVFTHLPSSLLLVTVAIAPNLWIASILFLLREGLVEMDVPTRSSYVVAVVAPHERTAASGITGIVRIGGWAVGAAIAGPLMDGTSIVAPLVAGAGSKILYDLLLWRAFKHVKPPEER